MPGFKRLSCCLLNYFNQHAHHSLLLPRTRLPKNSPKTWRRQLKKPDAILSSRPLPKRSAIEGKGALGGFKATAKHLCIGVSPIQQSEPLPDTALCARA